MHLFHGGGPNLREIRTSLECCQVSPNVPRLCLAGVGIGIALKRLVCHVTNVRVSCDYCGSRTGCSCEPHKLGGDAVAQCQPTNKLERFQLTAIFFSMDKTILNVGHLPRHASVDNASSLSVEIGLTHSHPTSFRAHVHEFLGQKTAQGGPFSPIPS